MAGIRKIVHSALSVKKLETSISFYRDVLGMELAFSIPETASGEELSASLGVPNAVIRSAGLRVPGTDHMIELLEYAGDERPVDKQLPQNAVGHAHIAFEVDNLKEMKAYLEKHGVDFFPGPTRIDEGPLASWKWIYCRDPDGTVLELVEIDG
ncbi:MAG: VOC family protein [Spirochaetales bacterium]|nr:VOC family protein [Spirochaetales bacterium]MCF7939009.1 VOC family protein [Spirochaetales bacterium]